MKVAERKSESMTERETQQGDGSALNRESVLTAKSENWLGIQPDARNASNTMRSVLKKEQRKESRMEDA